MNQQLILQYLASHPCVDCGEQDALLLEFDHRDMAQKQNEVSRLLRTASWGTVLREIARCDVRCVKCHRRRTATQCMWKKLAAA